MEFISSTVAKVQAMFDGDDSDVEKNPEVKVEESVQPAEEQKSNGDVRLEIPAANEEEEDDEEEEDEEEEESESSSSESDSDEEEMEDGRVRRRKKERGEPYD